MVQRHARRGEIIIKQQRFLIQRHTISAISTVEAEHLLEVLRGIQAEHRVHLARLTR
jgi:hypothetical protein